MKSKLLLVCFFCFVANAYAQNAFYNTRKILAWRDEIVKLNSSFIKNADSAFALKKAYIDSITSMVFYYTGDKKWDSIVKYTGMAELYNFITGQLINTSLLKKYFFENSRQGIQLRSNFNEIKSLFDEIDDNHEKSKAWSQLMFNNSDTASFNSNYHLVLPNPGNDTGYQYSQQFFILTKWKEALDSFRKERAKADRQINVASKKLVKEIEEKKPALMEALRGQNINLKSETISAQAGFNAAVKTSFDNSTATALNDNQQAVQQLKNFSFPSQSDIIDALAIYLAKRVKQEAVLAFTDQLKQHLKTDTLLNVFFPETKRLFMSLADYEFPRFGSAWRYAISKDFIQLPDNFFKSQYAQRWFGDSTYPYFNDVYQVATLIRKKFTFLEIVEDLNTRQEESDTHDVLQTDALKQFVNISHIINKELFNSDKNTLYWINTDLWANSTKEEFQVFWALINEKYPDILRLIHFKKGDSRFSLTPETEKKIKLWIKRILGALNKFQDNQDELYKASIKNPDKNWEFHVSTYWDNIHDIIQMVINNDLVNFKYKASLEKIDMTIERLFNVYEAIQQKNYASAVEETLHMIETFVKLPQSIKAVNWNAIFDKNRFKLNAQGMADTKGESLMDALGKIYLKDSTLTGSGLVQQIINATDSANAGAITARLLAAKPNLDTVLKVIQKYAGQYEIFKGINLTDKLELLLDNANPLYIKFVEKHPGAVTVVRKAAAIFQDIISASNSDGLSKVIESYAMPAGSYKVKRQSSFSIDLNAYFGVYGGTEWAQDSAGKYNFKDGGSVFGLSAPIGFSFSWAQYARDNDSKAGAYTSRKKALKSQYAIRRFRGSSHTISLGIIDIGAVVSYRLSNSAEKPLPDKLKWGQVLAPGIFYRYGFRNTPFCFNAGVQYAPLLRTVGKDNARNTWRASVGIMMDLPMFNIYHPQ